MIFIVDANDPATILADADTFFGLYFPRATDNDEVAYLNTFFNPCNTDPNLEFLGRQAAALVQVYDLVLPFDGTKAEGFLLRLGAIGRALLANRDDKPHKQLDQPNCPPDNPYFVTFPGTPYFDTFREKFMPAWGFFTPDRDLKWNTDPYSSGFLAYPMAAFARRVLDHPARYAEYQGQAFDFITAVIETYQGFLPERHLDEGDPHAYFKSPAKYADLACADGPKQHSCQGYKKGAGSPIAFNENLAMMQALAECALAADSPLYRGSGTATQEQLRLAREEMPLLVAKNVAFFVDNLSSDTLSDGTPYFDWTSNPGGSGTEDLNHAGFLLACLAVIIDLQTSLNSLLARTGRAERVPFSTSVGVGLANTFLRKVWQSDNTLSGDIEGKNHSAKNNAGCAGWVPYAQFDPWVWRRCRDTWFIYTETPDKDKVNQVNHAALLRYRKFNSIKYLRDFAGQNWVITPAPLAAGESRPTSIHDQKWLLILSGVVIADLRGEDGEWETQTVSFLPDMAGPDVPDSTSGPLNWTINQYSIPKPAGSPGKDYLIRFSVEQWVPFVAPNAMFNESQSMNCGFAVDLWRPNHFGSGTDVLTNLPVNNIFAGINADLAVRGKDAWLYRLGYRVTLLGKIVFVATP